MKIINTVQEKILKSVGGLRNSEEFYLTGGTALSYFYLKHRQSNDLDFFTSTEDLIDPFSHQLETYLKSRGCECQRRRGFHSFIELVVGFQQETTLVHLALDAAFRLEQLKEFPEYPRLKVESLLDIASNKLLALFGRATLRDFIDVYSLVKKQGFTKRQLTDAAVRKDPGFDLYWLGVAFERSHTFSSDSADMLLLLEPVDIKELQEFFDKWRKEIIGELKS